MSKISWIVLLDLEKTEVVTMLLKAKIYFNIFDLKDEISYIP